MHKTECNRIFQIIVHPSFNVPCLHDEYENQNILFTGHHPMRISELFAMIKEMLGKDLIIEYKNPEEKNMEGHYTITPYKFIPKMGKKLVSPCYTDMGQGLLLCMQEIHDQIHFRHGKQRV